MATVKRILVNPDYLGTIYLNRHNTEAVEREISSIDASLKTVNEERERLIYLFQKGIVAEEDIASKLAEINGRINILTVRKKDLGRKTVSTGISMDFIEDIWKLSSEIGPEIDGLNFEEKLHLIRLLVNKVELVLNDEPQVYIQDIRIGGQ